VENCLRITIASFFYSVSLLNRNNITLKAIFFTLQCYIATCNHGLAIIQDRTKTIKTIVVELKVTTYLHERLITTSNFNMKPLVARF